MSILFKLPDNLVSLLLLEWVGVSDVTHLDSACCNHFDRTMLLEALQSPQNVFCAAHHIFHCIRWMVLRSMKCATASIWCSKEFEESTFCRFLHLCGEHLKELAFCMNSNQPTKISFLLEEVIRHSPNLESLCVETSSQQDTVLHLISQLPKLKKLDLIGGQTVRTTHEGGHIASLTQLQTLVLTGRTSNPFNPPFFESVLQAAPCLTHLELKYVDGVKFEAIAYLCPNLRTLSLVNTAIRATNLVLISEKCPHISNLKLDHFWSGEEDSVYEAVFQNLQLHTLYLNHCYASDTAISYIGKHLHNTLTTLYFSREMRQCDCSVYWNVLQQCNRLHTLLMDASLLYALGFYHDRLKSELSTFEHIQSLRLQTTLCRALQFIHELFPNLRALQVHSGADEVMDNLIGTVESCTQLRTLHVQKMQDTTKRAMQNINPRLLIYTN